MRANSVGTTITGVIDMRGYILEKYDGLFPKDYPTKREYVEVCRALRVDPRDEVARLKKEKMDKKIKAFRREWAKLQ